MKIAIIGGGYMGLVSGAFFANSMAGAILDAEAIFIAVGAPTRRGDGHAAPNQWRFQPMLTALDSSTFIRAADRP